ncbi:MAG TPA: deiodinase-like protein [Cyclobacteriaceae bacterium]|nr:deiodinase-like protein [Cyclobacteriaceae bacterium]
MTKRLILHAFSAIALLAAACAEKVVPPDDTAKVKDAISEALISGWEQMGFKQGQSAPDFTLFSSDSKPFTLSKELKKKKPIVMINASYTCDVSRANLESILDLANTYSKDANFFFVYTIDAHPSDSPGPYSLENKIEIPKNNVRDKVQAKQPKTYAERKALAERWKSRYNIPITVLIDSPDNYFWTNFGQAPNMIYIIAPDKNVVFKQAWFNHGTATSELQKLSSE